MHLSITCFNWVALCIHTHTQTVEFNWFNVLSSGGLLALFFTASSSPLKDSSSEGPSLTIRGKM